MGEALNLNVEPAINVMRNAQLILAFLALCSFSIRLHGATNLLPVNTPPPANTPVVDPDQTVLQWSPGPNEVCFRVYAGSSTLKQQAYVLRNNHVLADLDSDT